MLSNECSQKSDIARLMVIGILKTYNYGLKCSLTFLHVCVCVCVFFFLFYLIKLKKNLFSMCIEQKRYIVLSTMAENCFYFILKMARMFINGIFNRHDKHYINALKTMHVQSL